MPTIEVTVLVAAAIEERMVTGQSADEVLRPLLGLPAKNGRAPSTGPLLAIGGLVMGARRRNLASTRMSSYVTGDSLVVEFQGGARRSWQLPDKKDKASLKRMRDAAVDFARSNAATIGQINAVKKALTDTGYHLYK